MKRLSIIAGVVAILAAPFAAAQDTPSLMEKRLNSCGTSAFETVFVDGAPLGYRHKAHDVAGMTYVGDAILEWCQSAQNAVIYFYVDNPGAPTHKACPESMSFAVFPGRGAEAEQILRDNIPSYHTPNVKLIEEPKLGPVSLAVAGDRRIEAFQLEAVLVDSAGMNRRQKMIGYARNGAFIRIMTGTVENPACANATTKAFLASLKWP